MCGPSQPHPAWGSSGEGVVQTATSGLRTPGLCGQHPDCQSGAPGGASAGDSDPRVTGTKGFLCFALVFCALVQVAFWSFRKPTQVEDAVLDTYDLVYDQAVKSSSSIWRQELAAIQDTFLCCGKSSPFSLLGSSEADLCRGAEAERQDCLQGIRSFLRTHRNITFTLTAIGLASTVYGMLLSSFLWFTIRAGCSLDRKGRYTLSPGARGCQPQEPSFFRCSQWGPAPQHSSKADALSGRLGPRGHSDGPWLLQGD
ncbi:tetraspanin-32 isoform X2 [Equus quagga]|uniref:tetraspanin-32 isoform X2 n=1 Tax=Equus quagga TaxID=89248 RepID=UPI001EE2A430|nr:tetraspanin-32 isoform X2 [Equus quagga]